MGGEPQDRALLGLPDAACGRAAWIVWAAFALVMGFVTARSVARDPTYQVSNDVYEQAADAWWRQRDLYRPFSDRGFLYLPHSAILYTPFATGDVVVRHVAVRTVHAALLVVGLLALARIGAAGRRGVRFALLTLATLPLAVQNFRQGQMNTAMVGAMLLATAALARGRWGWAAVALTFAVVLKPISAPLLLLAGALYPRTLARPLLPALAVAFAAPFLAGPPEYVASQYRDFAAKLAFANAPPTHYHDLRGLLETGLGVVLPTAVLTLLRALAALAVLVLAWRAVRPLGPERAAPALYVLVACWLMLFNPKTEDPTYLVLGPAVGILLVEAWSRRRPRLERALLALLPTALALAFELAGGRRLYWTRPLLALLFAVHAVVRLRGVRGAEDPERA